MSFNSAPLYLFLHNPSAVSVRVTDGKVYIIGDRQSGTSQGIIPSSVLAGTDSCTSVCHRPCVNATWTVTFRDIDFGDCNSCTKNLGIRFELVRPYIEQPSDTVDNIMNVPLIYSPNPGVNTGTAIATAFATMIANSQNQGYSHDFYGVIVTQTGDTLRLEFPCPDDLRVYPYNYFGLSTAEMPVITNVVPLQLPILTNEMLQTIFPKYAFSNLPGERDGRAYFSDCESVCMISLTGCRSFCDDLYAGHTGLGFSGNEVFDLQLFVNASATGYNAFIAALNAAIPNCNGNLGNRPLQRNQVLYNKSANSSANTYVDNDLSIAWAGVQTTVPGYNGAVRISFTSTAAPGLNASIAVTPTVAQDAPLLIAAFAAAGFTMLSNPAPLPNDTIRFNSGKNSDTIVMVYSVP